MFENRPLPQRLLIRRIQAHGPDTVIEAQKIAGFAVGMAYMPFWLPSLIYLKKICEHLKKGWSADQWKEAEKLRAEKELR